MKMMKITFSEYQYLESVFTNKAISNSNHSFNSIDLLQVITIRYEEYVVYAAGDYVLRRMQSLLFIDRNKHGYRRQHSFFTNVTLSTTFSNWVSALLSNCN